MLLYIFIVVYIYNLSSLYVIFNCIYIIIHASDKNEDRQSESAEEKSQKFQEELLNMDILPLPTLYQVLTILNMKDPMNKTSKILVLLGGSEEDSAYSTLNITKPSNPSLALVRGLNLRF